MILADTSAWIEFLRRSEEPADLALTHLIEEGSDLGTSEVVIMEVLAGARSERDRARMRSLLMTLPILTLRGLADFEEAALIYRACRSAVPAIRAGAQVLHNDADFDAIARHTPLHIYSMA